MKNIFIQSLTVALVFLFGGCKSTSNFSTKQESYKAEWSSLAKHNIPQWLLDAKFGIYCHWGYQTPLLESPDENLDYLEGFNRWTGEKFDPAKWAQLFKDAGAQFAGPVAQHCSGCLNWDSSITDWTSVKHGPKIDILGALEPEIKKRGMKYMASFHSITYNGIWGQISKNNKKILPPVDFKKDYVDRNSQEWMQGWAERIDEATSKYNLDLIWFDCSLGRTIGGDLRGYINQGKLLPIKGFPEKENIGGLHEGYQQKVIANYYNMALNKGLDVDVVYKSYDIPNNIGMRDIENGNLDGKQYDPWMTDITMLCLPRGKKWGNIWFWSKDCPVKDYNFLIDMLIDITSKNGRMLLNVPPKTDGTFDESLTKELYAMGAWLKVNGEGIYGSTPWCLYGEGPTIVKHPGQHGQTQAGGKEMAHFTADDLRYTTKGSNIYAFVLGKPANGYSRFMALGSNEKLYPNEIKDIKLLGSNEKIEWKHEANYLEVHFPNKVADQPAYCFKIIRNKI